jgi:Flp pilus assembly protein TadD
MVASLARGLYYADGQMRDEVYNYGSFKQSKMFAAGVTCSDCHEPHSGKLRFSGSDTCLTCHAPAKYTAATHHHHQQATPPLTCPACHMPTQTYMVVDPRHDHSFRIPRPDLTTRLDTPNVCTSCHRDKSAAWAASTIEQWYGAVPETFQNYGEAFHAAWSDRSDASALLAAVAGDPKAPGIARAGALAQLTSRASSLPITLAQNSLRDPDPMVRIGALDMLEGLPLRQRWRFASPLLSDPIRGVRIRAVAVLAATPETQLLQSERAPFERAAAEFIAAQQLNADRPEARTVLANFYAQRGATAQAEVEYRAALRLSPQYAAAYVNLADLYRQSGRDSDAETLLKTAAAIVAADAGVHHALGLTLVRLKRLDEALGELRKATTLDPDNARYSYVYGVALNASGKKAEALAVLKGTLAHHPNDRDTLLALISFSRDAGDVSSALHYAEQLARSAPGDPNLDGLIAELRRQANTPAQQ